VASGALIVTVRFRVATCGGTLESVALIVKLKTPASVDARRPRVSMFMKTR
jgi:hypothetical protein